MVHFEVGAGVFDANKLMHCPYTDSYLIWASGTTSGKADRNDRLPAGTQFPTDLEEVCKPSGCKLAYFLQGLIVFKGILHTWDDLQGISESAFPGLCDNI